MAEEKMLSPLKAIRKHCVECCHGSAHEVSLCPCADCNLYPYRFGKRTNGRKLSEEQRQAAAERLRKWREQQQ